jgi:hypothetical protein
MAGSAERYENPKLQKTEQMHNDLAKTYDTFPRMKCEEEESEKLVVKRDFCTL